MTATLGFNSFKTPKYGINIALKGSANVRLKFLIHVWNSGLRGESWQSYMYIWQQVKILLSPFHWKEVSFSMMYMYTVDMTV